MKNIIKKLKRGFTIVELVIVIAVIAILAAVLIPTLANVINMAEESNDIQTVKNLNTIVSAYDSLGEITTVNDALDGALENGYSVSALTPTSDGNVIVYDASSNRFALLSKNALTKDATEDDIIYTDGSTSKTDWTTSTTWVFIEEDDVTPDSTSGIYDLTTSYSTSVILVGSDWNGQKVKASYGVTLYDYLGSTTLASLEIVNSDTDSSKQTINSGSVSNNKSAVAKTTIANSTDEIYITVNVNTIYLSCKASVYEIMNYSETQMTAVKGCKLNEYGSTLVYEAASIGSGKIENYNSKISKNISINVDGSTVKDASAIFTDKTSTLTITEISNATTTVEIKVDTTTETTVKITIDDAEIEVSISATGTVISGLEGGSSISPYTISTLADFDVLRTMIEAGTTEGVYYKLVNDIDLGTAWEPLGTVVYIGTSGSATIYSDECKMFNGIFDGGGYQITMHNTTAFDSYDVDYVDYSLFAYVGKGAEIKNLNVYMDMAEEVYDTSTCGAVASYVLGDGADSILFENITVYGNIYSIAYGGGVVGWAAQGCTFKNCVNYANITTNRTSYSCIGGISAQASSVAYNCTYVDSNGKTHTLSSYDKSVSFIDCANYGTLTHKATNGSTTYSIIGNITAQVANNASSGLTALDESGVKYSTLTFTNCICEGTIYGVKRSSDSSYCFEGYIYGSEETTYDASTQTANPNKLLIGYITPNTVIDGTTVNDTNSGIIFPNGVAIETGSED